MIHTTNRRRKNYQPLFPLINTLIHDTAKMVEANHDITAKPKSNVLEQEDKFIIEMALPGYKKSDLDIKIEKNSITIQSDKSLGDNSDKVRFEEFKVGAFKRTFRLPQNINISKIAANLKVGLLTIEIPKLEAIKPTQITIK